MVRQLALPHTGYVPGLNTASLETSERLETEMSGLRAQLTSLRSASLDVATDFLEILAPEPACESAPTLLVDDGIAVLPSSDVPDNVHPLRPVGTSVPLEF